MMRPFEEFDTTYDEVNGCLHTSTTVVDVGDGESAEVCDICLLRIADVPDQG